MAHLGGHPSTGQFSIQHGAYRRACADDVNARRDQPLRPFHCGRELLDAGMLRLLFSFFADSENREAGSRLAILFRFPSKDEGARPKRSI